MEINDSGEKSEFAANLNVFRQIDFFSQIPVEGMKLFALLCKRQLYKAGDPIFNQGDDDGSSYYLLSGRAKLVLKQEKQEYVIREYKEENYFGILSLMTSMVNLFSLIAVEDTYCMVMTREAFSKVVDQFPDIPLKIMRSIGQRVTQAEKKCIMEFESNRSEDLLNLLGISLI
jgi:CRP-like cAMP-binding protein